MYNIILKAALRGAGRSDSVKVSVRDDTEQPGNLKATADALQDGK